MVRTFARSAVVSPSGYDAARGPCPSVRGFSAVHEPPGAFHALCRPYTRVTPEGLIFAPVRAGNRPYLRYFSKDVQFIVFCRESVYGLLRPYYAPSALFGRR